MTNDTSCPSEFALERWRFGELAASPEEAPLVAHVDGCPACRRRQAELAEADGPPPDSDAIWSRALASGCLGRQSPRSRWMTHGLRWVATATLGIAFAATLVVALRRQNPDAITKGGAWQLGIIAKTRDGSIRRLDPGAPLSPGDRLRFEVFTNRPRADIALVMLDSAGKVSRLAPAEGRSRAISGGRRVLLDETVELDGALGSERIVLVACDRSMEVSDVVASARRALAAAHGDPRQVDSLGTGCHEETFWITKVSR
ncbi:MAG TPA: hypothetical protein VJ860_01880 [Polyangia bacterium]|nr:hypothetical protein [Polyangia bacterium]